MIPCQLRYQWEPDVMLYKAWCDACAGTYYFHNEEAIRRWALKHSKDAIVRLEAIRREPEPRAVQDRDGLLLLISLAGLLLFVGYLIATN